MVTIKREYEIKVSDSISTIRFAVQSTVLPFWVFPIASQLSFHPTGDNTLLCIESEIIHYDKGICKVCMHVY